MDAPSLTIGGIPIRNGLVLAPMENVTDLTFRRLIRQIGGCGLTVTEFVPARGLVHTEKRVMKMLQWDEDERPVAVQVYGRDPELLAQGAAIAAELGADIIDLNMGCPSKKVCRNSGGSGLMKEPLLARDIVRAIRAAVSVPFTVKMRAGWDAALKNAPDLAAMCEDEGADAVAVHWRTREDLYGGQRDLSTIAQVKARVGIPVLANGDIIDAASAQQTLAETGCDGLMIGRGAIRNPWVFREIEAAMHGHPPVIVDPAERHRVLLGYLDAIRTTFRSDIGALGRFKKIARYFCNGVPDGGRLRQEVFHSQTVEEAIERVDAFFESLTAQGRAGSLGDQDPDRGGGEQAA